MLPSGFTSGSPSVETADGEVDEAYPPMSVTVRLEDEIDVSRGDMICRPQQPADRGPGRRRDDLLDGRAAPMRPGGKYAIKHTTRTARTIVKELQYRLDVNTLHRDEEADPLTLNEIGRVRLRTTVPLWPTTTPATATPAASSSSTRRRTAPSPPA